MNKLQFEKSPYLLQHKDNPVDWYAWGDEAFEKAKAENKPIFLSIGYATCHWCHVMAHESFEDPSIAELLNNSFINIKLDREERPDIDSAYMKVCQMLNGHGGWPLTIMMNPEKEPFFAGTYIPKDPRNNRIGLRQLIPGVKAMWDQEPAKVQKAVESIKGGFSKSLEFETGPFPGTEAIDFAAEQLLQRFDLKFGGFGSAPKFPTPHNLLFLSREWHQKKDPRFKQAVTETLTAMRLGGIWDHVGYGFHRYATDREWVLPHFEKMLYDQALLMMAYTEGWQISGNPLFKQTILEIAAYVNRNLTHPEGGFYSAEDADSEGEEGKFYIWTVAEIEKHLNPEDASWFKDLFNLDEDGNYADEATQVKNGTNIPFLQHPISKTDAERFETIRTKLFEHRETRPRPELDDKTLTDWNALMIAALAKAGKVLVSQTLIDTAVKAYSFITENLATSEGLMHRYKEGEAAIHALADDYAFLTHAAIELYEATFEPTYLKDAIKWNQELLDQFWDKENGGFYLSNFDEDLPLGKEKIIYDGAIPSANSVAMLNLLRLSRFTGKTELEDQVQELGQFFSAELIRSGSSTTMAMLAIQYLNYNPKEIVVVEGEDSAQPLLELLQKTYLPHAVVLLKKSGDQELSTLAPYTASHQPLHNKTALYLCENFSCQHPVTNLDDAKKLIN